VSLDRFFTAAHLPVVVVDGGEAGNAEVPESINWEMFLRSIEQARARGGVVVEGFNLGANLELWRSVDSLICVSFADDEKDHARARRRVL
jgi:hypothetical protein